uniref:7TM_GPCR_Srx domain-containing protein n=1 Tax=Parastrongyloides trichosuri TaxID=131310 RepID=A0A0N4ZAG0_PARTI
MKFIIKILNNLRTILHLLLYTFLWILIGLWISNDQLHEIFSLTTFTQYNRSYWYKFFTFAAFIQCITFTFFFTSLHSLYLILYFKGFFEDLKVINVDRLHTYVMSFDFAINISLIYLIGTLLTLLGYIIGYHQQQEYVFCIYGYGIIGALVIDSILVNSRKCLIRRYEDVPINCYENA